MALRDLSVNRCLVRACTISCAAILTFGLSTPPALTWADSSVPQRDPSGIALVSQVTQARPANEPQALALDNAMQFAMANPNDVGYPWIDPQSGTLEISAATTKGRAILGAVQGAITVPNRIRNVSFSYGQLESIKHEATTLAAAGLLDADLIYETAPDDQSDRVVITIRTLSEDLLKELASRYGTEAIAVRVDPNDYQAGTGSRQSDANPFWGGAFIRAPGASCTSGFPWYIAGVQYAMLTAGHCAPNGGSVSTPVSSMGTVTSASEENWDVTNGTQYFTGQSVYRGDLALVRIPTSMSSGTEIYRGAWNSGTHSTVKYIWYRSPAVGDLFYTGGAVSGELGTWQVTQARMDKLYLFDGPSVWARNVTEGTKSGDCIQHGDSGGSVFTNTTGGVAAKGIISGMGFITCYVYFTDIRSADDGLAGHLNTG